jgi:hypothetical protein
MVEGASILLGRRGRNIRVANRISFQYAECPFDCGLGLRVRKEGREHMRTRADHIADHIADHGCR